MCIRAKHKDRQLTLGAAQQRRPRSRDEALVLRSLAEATGHGGVSICLDANRDRSTQDADETVRDIIDAVDKRYGRQADLSTCGPESLSDVLARACRLGFRTVETKIAVRTLRPISYTGADLCRMFADAWSPLHERALREAFRLGQQQAAEQLQGE